MDLLRGTPAFSVVDASRIARALYGLEGEAAPLPSERDQNFSVRVSDGRRFVLKIANSSVSPRNLEAQNLAMRRASDRGISCPHVVPTLSGDEIGHWKSVNTQDFLVRLLTWVPGVPVGAQAYRAWTLIREVGAQLADLRLALDGFEHPGIYRGLAWNLQGAWDTIRELAALITDEKTRSRVERIALNAEQHLRSTIGSLPEGAIHNDTNDFNILVDSSGAPFDRYQHVSGIIDFGDLSYGIRVADLAIGIAYVACLQRAPLAAAAQMVASYHRRARLLDVELSALFDLARLRLALSVVIAARNGRDRPEDSYLLISQDAIRATLPTLLRIDSRFAETAFRNACGLPPIPRTARVISWLENQRGQISPLLDCDMSTAVAVDLSVGSPLVAGESASNTAAALGARIDAFLTSRASGVGIGRYGEPRLIYTSSMFRVADNDPERRTIHLGLDLFAPAGTPVLAPIDGTVHAFADNREHQDYGPVIVLRHDTDEGDTFYTLYGHLHRGSLDSIDVGQPVRAGEEFATLGSDAENGGWPPHLHFQFIVDLLNLDCDFPGVAAPSEFDTWTLVSPDPSPFAPGVSADLSIQSTHTLSVALERRKRLLPDNLQLSYRTPLFIKRGWRQFLYDFQGQRFLDAYNNVPHVGHSHPRVVAAVAEQSSVLNTNTRYLHDSILRFAERLVATLPPSLDVCFFVNSGSEANDLALRLARAYTGGEDILVLEHGYHGITSTTTAVSHYKFAGRGGQRAAEWVHAVPVPNVYRDRLSAVDGGTHYAALVLEELSRLTRVGRSPAAFLCESAPSVAGQLLLPHGYLQAVYQAVREAGGVCVADEVQTAYGRLGTHFYGFEAQAVVPDVVVLGKPIGNGFPIGAVVTRREIAASFANGMEFFSTFGGNTLAGAVGATVLDIVQEEQLQEHALNVGNHLLRGLRALAESHPTIGDVRGSGLFIGVELVKDRTTRAPAAEEAAYTTERLRESGILIGIEGPHGNVLKIRPPLVFEKADADTLVAALDRTLAELNPMQSRSRLSLGTLAEN